MATFINPAGYLKIILGPMTSGKTTELIKEYNRHLAGGFNCCFINHSTDDRYGSGNSKTSTHNKSVVNNTFSCEKLDYLMLDEHERIEPYDVFFINEGQFFSDLKFYVDYLVNRKNKKVYVCGLDGDFRREKFGTLLDIIPICDDIIKLKALCIRCKKNEAIFTHRLTSEKEQTIVGGSESYCALCRSCYNNNFYDGVEIV
tara:strand:- start:5 stop:607 length:603 start_codon:yes stop_codon:yes gene_type:complete